MWHILAELVRQDPLEHRTHLSHPFQSGMGSLYRLEQTSAVEDQLLVGPPDSYLQFVRWYNRLLGCWILLLGNILDQALPYKLRSRSLAYIHARGTLCCLQFVDHRMIQRGFSDRERLVLQPHMASETTKPSDLHLDLECCLELVHRTIRF